MPHRLEITLQPELLDAEGEGIRKKAGAYFGIMIDTVRTVHVLTIDVDLAPEQLKHIRCDIFTNPVTQMSSYETLQIDFDWCIWVGYRPGVKDNPGSTAVEAMEDVLGIRLSAGEGVYTSKRFCIKGPKITSQDAMTIARELLSNDIIQQVKIFSRSQWDPKDGIGIIIPKVKLDHVPTVTAIPMETDEMLKQVSDRRNLALNINDIPVIRSYFLDADTRAQRQQIGLLQPTDVELEYISQGRSDHCNHNTFRGIFAYRDLSTGEARTFDNLFKTFIEAPTLA